MATFSSITRNHVLQAIADCDDRGPDAFLAVYGYEAHPGETLRHEGRTYDSRAILGVAHRYATGRAALAEEFKEPGIAARYLCKLGFDATSPRGSTGVAPRGARLRAVGADDPHRRTNSRKPRQTKPEDRPASFCPTCFTQLPGTGVCDNCD